MGGQQRAAPNAEPCRLPLVGQQSHALQPTAAVRDAAVALEAAAIDGLRGDECFHLLGQIEQPKPSQWIGGGKAAARVSPGWRTEFIIHSQGADVVESLTRIADAFRQKPTACPSRRGSLAAA
ncbi:MAG: hypothetical protein ABIN96_11140 [Rubrivivax sp.]